MTVQLQVRDGAGAQRLKWPRPIVAPNVSNVLYPSRQIAVFSFILFVRKNALSHCTFFAIIYDYEVKQHDAAWRIRWKFDWFSLYALLFENMTTLSQNQKYRTYALSSEEHRATSTCTENFVKFIWFLRYASGQTFTQTYRRAYCNTSTPPEGGWSRHKISVAGGRRKKSYSLQTVVL